MRVEISIAVGNYDRVRPLVDGDVPIDGAMPVFMLLEPEEIFFRAFRHESFDVCELSLSSFALRTARGDCPYVGVPVFPSRAFRHTAITVRRDRIHAPGDLRGKRVGVPEYQLTANVWARAILAEDFGVAPESIDPDEPLYGSGLGLDSIDILEVALIVSKQYGVQLRANSEENQQIFRSLRHLAEYIAVQRTK